MSVQSPVNPSASPIRFPLYIIAVGWLIPGGAFLLLGPRYRKRAFLTLAVVHLTFILGIVLKGGLVWPVWSLNTQGFSIVNNLTFIVQLGAGWLSLLSLSAYQGYIGTLAAVEVHGWFELGSFYCMVAGALNYFVVCQALDRNHRKPFEILAKQ